MSQKGQNRLNAVYQYINGNNFASISELSQVFAVSQSTIKRDLDTLAKQGQIMRMHGGAMACVETATPPFMIRVQTAKDEKSRIAFAAAKLIDEGDVLLLDSGTTTFLLYRQIAVPNVKIFTTSIAILSTINQAVSQVYSLGGQAYANGMVLRGAMSIENLDHINPNKIFLSGVAFSEDYVLLKNYDSDNTFAQSMMKMQAKKYLLLDSSKFGKFGAFRSIPVQDFDFMVTDSGLSDSHAENIRALGVELIIV